MFPGLQHKRSSGHCVSAGLRWKIDVQINGAPAISMKVAELAGLACTDSTASRGAESIAGHRSGLVKIGPPGLAAVPVPIGQCL